MIAILRLDASGRILAADPAATAFLGPCAGRRYCDVVAARAGRFAHCDASCAGVLDDGPGREEAVRVRGQPCALTCVRVGSQVVVVLRPSLAEDTRETLTVREREVLAEVALGHSSAGIARRLGLRPSTVRTHVERARAKLGARTRAEAVAVALTRGDLPIP